MTDSGLTRRLRQQSHRSGLGVGITMALVIAICVGAFTLLYVKLDPWVRDFSGSQPAPTATAVEQASNDGEDEEPTEEPTEADEEPTAAPDDSEDISDPGNVSEADNQDDEQDGFDPDYQVAALEAVNFRSGPGTSFAPVSHVDPGTPLQYENETQPATEPENAGTNWMKFSLEDGREGWIRDVDVSQT